MYTLDFGLCKYHFEVLIGLPQKIAMVSNKMTNIPTYFEMQTNVQRQPTHGKTDQKQRWLLFWFSLRKAEELAR